jgi:hypothetical protein
MHSAATGVVAGLADGVNTIVYPRKSDVRFPASGVAYVTLHPALLWSDTIRSCWMKSVSMTMFALLAWDVTFTHIAAVDHIQDADCIARLRTEYAEARREFAKTGLEIHGLAQPEAVPYACLHKPDQADGSR